MRVGSRVRCFGPRRTIPFGENASREAIAPLSETHLPATCSFVTLNIVARAKDLSLLEKRVPRAPYLSTRPVFLSPQSLANGSADGSPALRCAQDSGDTGTTRPAPGVVARGALERFIGRGIVRKRAEGFNYSASGPADRKSTRLNSSHGGISRMPSSA